MRDLSQRKEISDLSGTFSINKKQSMRAARRLVEQDFYTGPYGIGRQELFVSLFTVEGRLLIGHLVKMCN
jgi:hypothetical protein